MNRLRWTDPASYSIQITSWQDQAEKLRFVRSAVFIREQRISEALEWDEYDAVSQHALAINAAGHPIGTARLLPDGHIGRMAVLKHYRGLGIGGALLQKILEEFAKQGLPQAILNAQTSAIKFYEKFGFRVDGDEFMEAGIPHVRMVLPVRSIRM
ncbi:MAG: GNAT family N-acetyltransferase [Nitrosomonas sp.]|nr:MAG: GNAT family N-acetyltransferase [Nitrosomonas sp.]